MAAPVPPAAAALAAALEDAGAPGWLAPLVARRGVEDAGDVDRFLRPALGQLHDPYLLSGMAPTVERLLAARDRGERVAVVGDYDVDGISATALLLATFGACGIAAEAILPHRLEEGYGFQPVHAERAHALGCRLIVTADCGSSSFDAVERAFALGVDVVVTDHHLPGCELPAGALQINPHQSCCTYPYRFLAAAGLALKLSLALAAACGRRVDPAALLRVACLGTIADLVPLTGENRVIAALGLEALAQARSEGLRALIRQAGIKPPFKAADVGFRIGPRINAAGRLDTPEQALELLLSRDARRAFQLAAALEGWNRQRQAEEARVVEEAGEVLGRRSPLPALLAAWSPGWHKGVVGVAAGRLAKELGRPVLLFGVEADGTATGSGRSVPGIELHSFLGRWRDRMARFGGHAQAVGLTVAVDRLESLQAEWEEAAAQWPAEVLVRRHTYELHLRPQAIRRALLVELSRLEPHGQGNPQPLVRVGPLQLAAPPRAFGNGHLALRARGEDGAVLDLIGWRWQGRTAAFASRFEVLAHLDIDAFSGEPALRLLDCRPASSDAVAPNVQPSP